MRLALVSIVLAGCFSKPDPPAGGPGDGSIGAAPVPRLLHKATYSLNGASPGMTHDGFSISTSGVVDGELVLFIAQIDNGNPSTWPTIAGFTEVSQRSYGGSDVQTSVIEAKIADHEPAEYTGSYMGIPAGVSGASIVTLLAVTGVDPAMPIGDSDVHVDPGYANSARGDLDGLTTTRSDSTLIYINSGDWLSGGTGQATFQRPAGFTKLTELGDHGDPGFDWGTIQISYRTQAAAGPTGPVSGSTTGENGKGTIMVDGYGALLSVQPPT